MCVFGLRNSQKHFQTDMVVTIYFTILWKQYDYRLQDISPIDCDQRKLDPIQEKEFIYDKLQDSVYKLQKEGATHINSCISNIYGINFDFTQKKSRETLKKSKLLIFLFNLGSQAQRSLHSQYADSQFTHFNCYTPNFRGSPKVEVVSTLWRPIPERCP